MSLRQAIQELIEEADGDSELQARVNRGVLEKVHVALEQAELLREKVGEVLSTPPVALHDEMIVEAIVTGHSAATMPPAVMQAVVEGLIEEAFGIRLVPVEDVMRITFPTAAYLEVHRRTGEVLDCRVITPLDAAQLHADHASDEEDLDRVRQAVTEQTWPEPEWEA